MVNLKEVPFSLQPEDIDWITSTLAEMTLEEKIGQMICTRGAAKDEHTLKELVSRFHIGAIMYRPIPTF